jgi:hypothetical protein
MWHNRPYKANFRMFAVANQGKPAKVYLTLPSDEILDIKAALLLQSIDRKTFIIAVEHDPKKAQTIRELLATMFDHFHVHAGPLHTLDLATVLAGRKIDMAFFDLCGQMTKDIAGWLLGLDNDSFTLGARVCWTFNLNYRKNDLADALSRSMPRRDLVRNVVCRCHNVTLTPNWAEPGLTHNVLLTLYALYGGLSSHWLFGFDKIHEYHDVRHPMLFVQTTINDTTSTTGNALARRLRSICGLPLKLPVVDGEEKAWEVLGCPSRMSPGQKMRHVKAAKRGVRPPWMKPQQWAWCALNPTGIRRAS